MSDKKERVLLGQLTKRFDKNKNMYFIGTFGMSTMTIFPHKTKPDVFNVFVSTKEFKKTDQNSGSEFPPPDFGPRDDFF